MAAPGAGLPAGEPGQAASRLASKLPEWAARCASLDGSGDDTTLALLLVPAAGAFRERGAGGS
jgi:hypothetical protein